MCEFSIGVPHQLESNEHTKLSHWSVHIMGNRIKSPRQKSPQKTPLNAVEREPVETRVLNPNASETS